MACCGILEGGLSIVGLHIRESGMYSKAVPSFCVLFDLGLSCDHQVVLSFVTI